MKSQYDRVLAVLKAAAQPLSLFEIRQAIMARFERMDSEAGISARIRDIRHDLEKAQAGTICARREQGKAWCRYSVRNPTSDSRRIDQGQLIC